MNVGKAILLNGASSAGKSSIANELKSMFDEVYYTVSIDQFIGNGPTYFFIDDPWIYYTDIPYPNAPVPQLEEKLFKKLISSFPNIVSGFHNSIEALLKTGNNLIIDHGFHKLDWMKEFVTLLHGYDTYLVGIMCDDAELERRETSRGDRPIGMAKYQSKVVHRDLIYDLEIDTGKVSSIDAAEKIRNYVANNNPAAITTIYNRIK